MNKLNLFIGFGVLFSAILVITAWTVARQRTVITSKAFSTAEPADGIFSANNSYIFASPITATADGVSPIRISVFILNSRGLGIAGKKVSLASTPQLKYSYSEQITDSFGRAIFEAVSQTPGDYSITAATSNVTLPQQVSISFR